MGSKEVDLSAVVLSNNDESDRELDTLVQDVLESKGLKSQICFFDEGKINQDIYDLVLKNRPRFVVVNMPYSYGRHREEIKKFTESLNGPDITVILATDGEEESLIDFQRRWYNSNVFLLVKPFQIKDLIHLIEDTPGSEKR